MNASWIRDVDEFEELLDQCSGKVELVSKEGDRVDLKGRMGQYLSLASMISNGYISALSLEAKDPADAALLAAASKNAN